MDQKFAWAFNRPKVATIPIIHLWNRTSRVEAPRDILVWLDEQLAVESPGAQWARQNKPGWDGFWHPLNVLSGRFPTGLYRRIKGLLPGCHVEDNRKRPPVRSEIDPYCLRVDPEKPEEPYVTLHGEKRLIPRDEQVAALIAALECGRGVLDLAMAVGKTEVGLLIAAHVPGKCVWIIHRKDLLHQTAERIRIRMGEEPALIGDGQWDERAGQDVKFVIAMDQTVGRPRIEHTANADKKHYDDLEIFSSQVADAKTVIFDEVHVTGAAQTFFMVAQYIPNAYFRIGLTGTATTDDPVRNRRLEAATGPILYKVSIAEATSKGYLAPARVIYHKAPAPIGPVTLGNYQDARRALIEDNGPRNALIVDLTVEAAQAGRRCLVICDTIRHVRHIADVLRDTGVRSVVLTGHHSSGVRSSAKKDLQSGVLEVAVVSPIWDMGVNLPQLDTVILAAGGKSSVKALQRVGRALRTSPGKTEAVIHDFWDAGSKYTLAHSQARLKLCRRERFAVEGPI